MVSSLGPVVTAFAYPPVNPTVLHADCYVTSIGTATHHPDTPYPPPGHPQEFSFDWDRGRRLADTTLVIITTGRGRWESNHSQGSLEPGDMLFVPAGSWHRYRPRLATGWQEKWLCLRGASLHKIRRDADLPDIPQVLKCDNLPTVKLRLDRLQADIMALPRANHLAWGIRGLALMLDCWSPTPPPPREPAPTPLHWPQNARVFIQNNSHRPIGVDDVARACGKSRRTIERHFQSTSNESVANLIARERVARAKILLTRSSLPIKAIATETGFQSNQHMIATFHRLEGRTPSSFRRESPHRILPVEVTSPDHAPVTDT